ncbi:MAG: hypothetical protein MI745_15615 [Pseudomonadales bacterium]|nr:hypothetical protein [Pseudomonadales bacterium]
MTRGNTVALRWGLLVSVMALLLIAAGVLMPLPQQPGPASVVTRQDTRLPVDRVGAKDGNWQPGGASTVRDSESTNEDPRVTGSDSSSPRWQAETISEALASLNLSESGQLQIDATARDVLEAAFMQPDSPMDAARFAQLQAQIQEQLPGEAGRQAAEVAERYYHYSNVYRDVEESFDYLGTVGEMERGLRQLHDLRRTYLGAELASELFGEEERMMRVTLENMRIQSDPSLSAEEKAEQQRSLNEITQADESP